MLPKSNRLPSLEIRALMYRGKRLSAPELQLVYHTNKLGVARFAFVVSTNIDKRATVRNRIKRLLRQSVRHLLPEIKPGFDIIFIIKGKPGASSSLQVEARVKQIFQQIKLL